ncbi:hypothetical protein HK101_000756 [Irineochytrium annulatum]|nr:hypothetical protein HK101_000756 [Irineochytrium annulatum]
MMMTTRSAVLSVLLASSAALLPAVVAAPVNMDSAAPLDRRWGGFGGFKYTGRGTYYTPDNGIGACGESLGNYDMIAAISMATFNSLGDNYSNPTCHKRVTVTNQANGKSLEVKIMDSCEACENGSLDLSYGAFQQIADLELGVIDIKWNWCDGNQPNLKAHEAIAEKAIVNLPGKAIDAEKPDAASPKVAVSVQVADADSNPAAVVTEEGAKNAAYPKADGVPAAANDDAVVLV